MASDGEHFRKVVPSPLPQRIIEMNVIRMLVDNGVVVICAGGGGIPVAYDENRKLFGVEAVIDKDLASGLLAKGLDADRFVMLTDVPNVFVNFGTEDQRSIRAASPDALRELDFAAGSMGPKVLGACNFVSETGQQSAIGKLADLTEIMAGTAGTLISNEIDGIRYMD
jgi:carbamate kinase